MDHQSLFLFLSLCFGFLFSVISSQAGSYAAAPAMSGGYPGGGASLPGPYGQLAAQTGGYDSGADARGYGGSGYSQYGASSPYGGHGQGSGVYFKKPVPIDEKPVFFRTPYWLPNLYYGHYGYPWTEWFDGGPRFVVPIMNAFPRGGGGTQSYNTGYGVQGVGQSGYGGGTDSYGAQNGTSSYSGGSPGYGGAGYADASTTPDPYNDGFSYYKGIPIYQTYYERYLLEQAQAATTTAAP
ncbi:hypothetical protein RvY_03485 [Ramazzottius varieornatus]|uniref:Uncharacterized protein n=1 Tax=Ramazzottius varieornatus TaxID=947166 RepID=A0A1D1UYE1_RAMVA|nr:hypothetical protein RvY_03485 [Ramazzottius varieornatus]